MADVTSHGVLSALARKNANTGSPGTADLEEWLAMTGGNQTGKHASTAWTNFGLDSVTSIVTNGEGGAMQGVWANTDYLGLDSNNTIFDINDDPYSIVVWMEHNDRASNQALLSKNGAAPNSSYFLYHIQSSNVFYFMVSGDGTAQPAVETTSGYTSGVHMIVCTHDPVANEIAISVDAGTPVTASFSGGVNSTTTVPYIGRDRSSYSQATYDEISWWRKKLSADEITWLYNGGDGRQYSDL